MNGMVTAAVIVPIITPNYIINEVKSSAGNKFQWTVRIARNTLDYRRQGYAGWTSSPFRVPCSPCEDGGYHKWVLRLIRRQEDKQYYSVMSLSESDMSADALSVFLARYKGTKMSLLLQSKMTFYNDLPGQTFFLESASNTLTGVSNFAKDFSGLTSYDEELCNTEMSKQMRQVIFILTCEVRRVSYC